MEKLWRPELLKYMCWSVEWEGRDIEFETWIVCKFTSLLVCKFESLVVYKFEGWEDSATKGFIISRCAGSGATRTRPSHEEMRKWPRSHIDLSRSSALLFSQIHSCSMSIIHWNPFHIDLLRSSTPLFLCSTTRHTYIAVLYSLVIYVVFCWKPSHIDDLSFTFEYTSLFHRQVLKWHTFGFLACRPRLTIYQATFSSWIHRRTRANFLSFIYLKNGS